MVKNHSDSERGNLLPPHGLLFLISSKVFFICTIPQTGYHIPHPLLHQSWSTGWNEKQLNGSTTKDPSDDPLHHDWTLLPWSYISISLFWNTNTPTVIIFYKVPFGWSTKSLSALTTPQGVTLSPLQVMVFIFPFKVINLCLKNAAVFKSNFVQ